jgi:glycine hydroxymethyltransferase
LGYVICVLLDKPTYTSFNRDKQESACIKHALFHVLHRGFDVVSGGTDNHLMLVSLIPKGITGKAADAALGLAHITVNKNAVPNDPESPFVTSGIRIGTPAPTSRGFKENEVTDIANWMCDVMENLEDETIITAVHTLVIF